MKGSEWNKLKSRVPQGSGLGLMLFLVYINDIADAMEAAGSIVIKFVDDTKMGRIVEDEKGREMAQSEINNMVEWMERWQMQFNAANC